MMSSQKEIDSLNDIEILDFMELGFGYISKVKMGRHRVTGDRYAVKIVG